MGDLSVEPSMEDILSSIKRIIAEEGEPAPARPRRQSRAAARAEPLDLDDEEGDEVLELNDPMPAPPARPVAAAPIAPASVAPAAAAPVPVAPSAAETDPDPEPVAMPSPAPQAAPAAEPILSQQTAAATRGSLEALSRLMVKPEPTGDGTLEGLVREMLRPMLREWLDANLPAMVEAMVKREIAKITGAPQ